MRCHLSYFIYYIKDNKCFLEETVIVSLRKKEKLLFDNRGVPYGKVKDGSVVATLDFYMVRSGRGQSSLSLISVSPPVVVLPSISILHKYFIQNKLCEK